jgi:hypothetical protein
MGDKEMQAEGKMDKAKGAAHNAAGDAKDIARDATRQRRLGHRAALSGRPCYFGGSGCRYPRRVSPRSGQVRTAKYQPLPALAGLHL